MVVTCENCATRFKFDERRIKPEGIKVHCSRCRRTFLLMPPPPAEAPAETRAETRAEARAEGPAEASAEVARQAPPWDNRVPIEPESPAAGGYALPEFLEDDPLADVPGFDPDELPAAAEMEASEEEKALEALTRDELRESSVAEALDRFGAAVKGEGGETSEEQGGAHLSGPHGRGDLDGSGHGGHDDAALPALEGDEAEGSFGLAEDFDWEQVSFTKDKEPLGPGPGKAGEDAGGNAPEDAGEDDTDLFIERTTHASEVPAATRAAESAAAAAQSSFDSSPLELDLSGVASKPAARPVAPPAARPALKTAPAAPLETPRREAAAPKKAKPVVIPPLRLRARVDREAMPVPKLAGLLLAAALGLAAVAAGAVTAYAPYRGASQVVRFADGAAGVSPLVIEDARGITIERLQGPSLYLITGTARWKGPSAGNTYLEGVITDSTGKVLERRPARLGPRPDWKTIEGVDPDHFAPVRALPAEGRTPFSLLFAPAPHWRGNVQFELRAAPR